MINLLAAVFPIRETGNTAGETGAEGTRVGIEEMLRAISEQNPQIKIVEMSQLDEATKRKLGIDDGSDKEADRLASVAEGITSEQATEMAAGALLGAGREFEQGHDEHARLKIDAAGVWTSLAEILERREQAAADRKRLKENDERMDRAHVLAKERGIPLNEAFMFLDNEEREARWAAAGVPSETSNSGNAPE